MKSKKAHTLLSLTASLLLVHAFVAAGPMPAEFRGVIHELFASHGDFKRTVEITKNGYRAKTVSENPEKASLLQKHVAQMEGRLDSGLSFRHWDPAYAELREHYEDMKIELEKIEGGIAVVVTGTTPEAILVAQNHAKIISGFIEKGPAQMHARHAAVADDVPLKTDSCKGGQCKMTKAEKGKSGKAPGCGKSECQATEGKKCGKEGCPVSASKTCGSCGKGECPPAEKGGCAGCEKSNATCCQKEKKKESAVNPAG